MLKNGSKDKNLIGEQLWEEFSEACDPDLKCPISRSPFKKPVILIGDGQTYEEEYLLLHLQSNSGNRSPLHNKPLTEEGKKFIPNTNIKKLVDTAFEKFKQAKKAKEAKKTQQNAPRAKQVNDNNNNNTINQLGTDPKLFALEHSLINIINSYQDPHTRQFQKKILAAGFIEKILVDKKSVFYLLSLFNNEWREEYVLSDELITKLNSSISLYIKMNFSAEEIKTQIQNHFGAIMAPKLGLCSDRLIELLAALSGVPVPKSSNKAESNILTSNVRVIPSNQAMTTTPSYPNSFWSKIDSLKMKMIGDSRVGKSCLLLRWVEKKYVDDYSTAKDHDFKLKTVCIDNNDIKIQVWDTCGQERNRDVFSQCDSGHKVFIFVVDLTDKRSLNNLKTHKEFALSGVTKILVATKSDVDADKRGIYLQELQEFAELHGLKGPFLTSARSGDNVEEVFEFAAKSAIQERYSNSNNNNSITTTTTITQPRW